MSSAMDRFGSLLSAGPWSISQLLLAKDVRTNRLDVEVSLVSQWGFIGSVTFVGVADLRFAQTSSNLAFAPQLVPMDERGWESLHFRVTDPVNGALSLWCSDVVVEFNAE